MGVARGIGEIVLPAALVHPAGLEEAVWVGGRKRLAGLRREDDHGARLFGKLQHIVGQARHPAGQRRLGALRQRSRLEGAVVAVALELSAPQAAEVDVVAAVAVAEHGLVDAVAAAHGVGLGAERAFGPVGYGHAHAEYVVLVLEREVHIVLAALLGHVAIPQLAARPGYVAHAQGHAVVGHLAVHHVVGGEHVVVLHVEVVAVVVFRHAALPVVAGVDVDPSAEHVCRRVGHVVAGQEVAHFLVHSCL